MSCLLYHCCILSSVCRLSVSALCSISVSAQRIVLFDVLLCYVVICDLSVPVSNDRMGGVLQRLSPGVEYSAVRTGREDGNGDDGL